MGPDGSTQNLQIPFLVQRMTVTNVTTKYYVDEERVASAKIPSIRYNSKPYTSAVVNGVASTTYNVTSLGAFPKGLKVTFKIENPVVEAKLRTSYVNTRAVSSRRIDIHSSVVVDVTIKSKREEQVVADAENCGIQLLKNCKNVCSFVGEAVKTFSLMETVDLGEGKSPVFQVLRVTSNIINEDMKATNNKVLVSGDLKVNVLYCTDTDKYHPEVFEHTLPISQIIDIDGISEKTNNSVSLCCSGVEVIPKNDSSGAKKLLDISASINAVIKAVTNIDIALPTDCYSTQYNLNCQKKTVRFENEVEKSVIV